MNIVQKAKEIDKLNRVEVPYFVWHLLGIESKEIMLSGSDSISLGEDFASVGEIRKALDWYVDQFGGKVKWK